MADSDRVDLTDLDVITRYSLAVRTSSATRTELIATLRSDLAWLEAGRSRTERTPTSRTAVKKTTAKKTAARRSR